MIKHPDTLGDPNLIRRTAIAEIIEDGFYGYNINVDVTKKQDTTNQYDVTLKIRGGEGTFYRFVYRNQPLRSLEFNRSFSKMHAQFVGSDNYYCNDLLPGFTCTMVDSAGRQELMMEKKVTDFPDARVEFECLTSNIRSIMGDSFLYYYTFTNDTLLRNVVFIRFVDHEKIQRKSISTSLVKTDNYYSVRLTMYHP